MSSGLAIKTQSVPAGGSRVSLAGVVDELADLRILAALPGPLEIELKGIRRLTSVGIRDWVDVMRALSQRTHVTFVECSPAVMRQLNMIQGFLGHGTIHSFYGPMRCDSCDVEVDTLFTVDACREVDGLPRTPCPKCRQAMELDDLEDDYLLFLREPTRVH